MRKLNSVLNLVIFTLVIILGGAFFYFKNSKEGRQPATKSSELSSQELDQIVNKYIKTTNQEALKTKIMAEKFMIETRKKLAEIERQKMLRQDKENAEIPKDRQIRKNNDWVEVSSPADLLLSKLNDKKMQEQQEEYEKQEYARQWILNARKAGYHLELSPDLEVIRYTPIRKPSQQDDSTDSTPSD